MSNYRIKNYLEFGFSVGTIYFLYQLSFHRASYIQRDSRGTPIKMGPFIYPLKIYKSGIGFGRISTFFHCSGIFRLEISYINVSSFIAKRERDD